MKNKFSKIIMAMSGKRTTRDGKIASEAATSDAILVKKPILNKNNYVEECQMKSFIGIRPSSPMVKAVPRFVLPLQEIRSS